MAGLSINEWKKGQRGSGVKDVAILAKVTTPPLPYTEGSLGDAMKGAGALVADPKLRAHLRDENGEPSGIGTAATRAAIIERLKEVGFLREEKVKATTYLRSSEQGKQLIKCVPALLTDPATTAVWEQMLELISRGEMPADQFLERQVVVVKKLVEEALRGAGELSRKEGVPCEKAGCSGGGCLTKRKSKYGSGNFWTCDKEGCTNKFEDTQGGPVMRAPAQEVEPLPGHGDACPKCHKGALVTKLVTNKASKSFGKRFLACNAYPGCKHSVWP